VSVHFHRHWIFHLDFSKEEVSKSEMSEGSQDLEDCCVSGQVLAKHIEGEEKASGLILSHTSTHFRDVLKEAKSDGLVLMRCTFAANTLYDSTSLEYALTAARSSVKEGSEEWKKLKMGVFDDDTVVGYEEHAATTSTSSGTTTTATTPQTEQETPSRGPPTGTLTYSSSSGPQKRSRRPIYSGKKACYSQFR
jgi:hypothetical protein